MAGPKTLLQDELRRLGGSEEAAHAQRFRPSPHGAPHVEAVRVHREQAARRAADDRASSANLSRASRAFRDAGLNYDASDRAMDLYVLHGTSPEAAISAVGGRRMSVDAARSIERALLPPNNPNDDRAYFHALNLHAAGVPVQAAIDQARHEDAQHRARRPRHLNVQEYPAPPVRIPPPPPRRPRHAADVETPSQRAQNAADNRHAAIGIGVMLAALAAGAAILFGRNDPAAPAQPRQPVKPPAPPTQPPKPQPPAPVKGQAFPPRR